MSTHEHPLSTPCTKPPWRPEHHRVIPSQESGGAGAVIYNWADVPGCQLPLPPWRPMSAIASEQLVSFLDYDDPSVIPSIALSYDQVGARGGAGRRAARAVCVGRCVCTCGCVV